MAAAPSAESLELIKNFSNYYLEVRVHPDPTRRFGVFATRPIPRGHCFLEEDPLAISLMPSEFNKCLIYESLTPEKKVLFDNLLPNCCPGCKEYDTVKKWSTNTIAFPGVKGFTLYNLGAYFNHDCSPNAHAEASCPVKDDGRLRIWSIYQIAAGTEITISYIPWPATTEQRQRYLKGPYNFTCTCSFCNNKRHITEQTFKFRKSQIRYTRACKIDNPPTTQDVERYKAVNDVIRQITKELEGEDSEICRLFFQALAPLKTADRRYVAPEQLYGYIDNIERWISRKVVFENGVSAEFFKRLRDRARHTRYFVWEWRNPRVVAEVYVDILRTSFLQ